jgi:hypothetical protein
MPWITRFSPLPRQTGQPFDFGFGLGSANHSPQPINNNVKPAVVDTRFNSGLNTLLPYNVLTNSTLRPNDTSGDIVYRFWHEQSQIDHERQSWAGHELL